MVVQKYTTKVQRVCISIMKFFVVCYKTFQIMYKMFALVVYLGCSIAVARLRRPYKTLQPTYGQNSKSTQISWEFSTTHLFCLQCSVTACTMDKNTFSAPFGIFYVRTEILKEIFQKKYYTTPQLGVFHLQTTISKWELP